MHCMGYILIDQRVTTPAIIDNLLCGDLSQPFNRYEQMVSQPAVIDNLFIIALHGVYLLVSFILVIAAQHQGSYSHIL